MEHEFWHERWNNNEIAFHNREVNPHLAAHFDQLNLKKISRVFVPLCGKTRDIAWLLQNGFGVVGAELSELAVIQLFEELHTAPTVKIINNLKLYQAPQLVVFVGDIFTLKADLLSHVDAIYDRAALVALPHEMRIKYTQHIMQITDSVQQLVICYEYDQNQLAGPPFSVDANELHSLYDQHYSLNLLATHPIAGGLKGKCPAVEKVWHLKNFSNSNR